MTRRLPLLIALLALLLRVYRLDGQSLWYDEGLSVYLASLPPAETIARSAVTDHPPLHALILNAWMHLAGSSEFAVRFASVFFDVIVVMLTWKLARGAGGDRAGAIAAGLIAIAPMAVWYGQEARGYSLLVALILIAVLAFKRLERGDWRARTWLAYVLACAGAMYTHYFAAFPIAAINLAFLIRLRRWGRSGSGRWLLAQLAVAALCLPWLPNALAQAGSNATYFPGRVTWDTVLLDMWWAFAAGDSPHLSYPLQLPPTGALWLAAIILGLLNPIFQRRSSGDRSRLQQNHPPQTPNSNSILTLICLIIVPLLLMSILAWERPKFAPRYLLPSLPAFVALAALGVDTLLRFRNRLLAVLALLPLALIPIVDAISVAQIYFDPPAARPDVRAVAAYIDAHDEPGDAVLLVGGHQRPAFEYYYHGDAEVIPLPPDILPAAQSPLDMRVVAQLAGIAQAHPRAWLVLWQENIADPMGLVLGELRDRAQRLEVGQTFHEMSLLLFDLRGATFAAGPGHALSVLFEGPIRLTGFDLNSNEFTASQELEFALYFESTGPIARNFRVFTHLIGPDGSIAAQDDHIAGADSYPTSLWATGAQVRNTFRIAIPLDAPPGNYRLIAGLYDGPDRLRVVGGDDSIEITTIVVRP